MKKLLGKLFLFSILTVGLASCGLFKGGGETCPAYGDLQEDDDCFQQYAEAEQQPN